MSDKKAGIPECGKEELAQALTHAALEELDEALAHMMTAKGHMERAGLFLLCPCALFIQDNIDRLARWLEVFE